MDRFVKTMEFIKFASVLLLALIFITLGSANKHHDARPKLSSAEGKSKWLSKAKSNNASQCRMVCEGMEPPKGRNVTRYDDGSWSYDINVGGQLNLQIMYNRVLNFLAIFNPNINITWLTNGIFIGIFNLTSNALLLVDTTKNLFNMFEIGANIIFNGQANLMLFFQRQFELALTNSAKLLVNFAYRVDGFLKSIRDRTLGAFFNGNVTILNAFNVNFGFYMNGKVKIDGYNTFLEPIVGVGKFGLEIISNIGASIEYGGKLTIATMNYIFVGFAKISEDIQSTISAIIQGTVHSTINFGVGFINSMLSLPSNLMNVITGALSMSGSIGFQYSTGSNKNHGFIINLFSNTTGNQSINYNNTHNALGFYNDNLQMVLIADGSLGMYMIFRPVNESLFAAIIVSSTGNGKLLTIEDLDMDVNTNLPSRFDFIAKILKDNSNVDLEGKMSFNFTTFLDSYLKGEEYLNAENEAELKLAIEDYFGGYFEYVVENNGTNLFAQFGVSSMFNVIYGQNVIAENFAQLMNSIYLENRGHFTVKLMAKAYTIFQKKVKKGSEGFTSYIFKDIVKTCVGGSLNFNGIIGAIGFSTKC